MRGILVILVLIATGFGAKLQAQDSTNVKRNSFYIDIFGASVFYSVNYERLILCAGDWKFGASVGFGTTTPDQFITAPIRITANLSFDRLVELNWFGGMNYIKGMDHDYANNNSRDPRPSKSLHAIWGVGVRYIKDHKGLFVGGGISGLHRVKKLPSEYTYTSGGDFFKNSYLPYLTFGFII